MKVPDSLATMEVYLILMKPQSQKLLMQRNMAYRSELPKLLMCFGMSNSLVNIAAVAFRLGGRRSLKHLAVTN